MGKVTPQWPHGWRGWSAVSVAAATRTGWSPSENLIAVRKLSLERVSDLRLSSLKVTKAIEPGAAVERSVAAAV